jgi:tetratricopeptide (TPR) repeat protein
MRWIAAAAIAWNLTAWFTPASAQDFAACDGYPEPGKKSDGITKDSLLLGLVSTSADFRPSDSVSLGRQGIAACDHALADARLKPEFVLRRIHLIQSRALHELAAGKPTEALASLDAAEAISLEPSILRRKGLGLANLALRAVALGDLGRKQDAIAQIEALQKARPFAPSIQRLAGTLRQRIDSSLEGHLAELRRRMPIDPGGALVGMIDAMLAGRNADVIGFSDGLEFDIPRMRGGWKIEGGGFNDYDLIKLRAFAASLRAYALVAEGREAEATALLADARQDLEAAKVEPEPRTPGKPLSKEQVADFERRKAVAAEGEHTIATWDRLVSLRKSVTTMMPEQLFANLDRFGRGEVSCVIDLIANLKTAGPADEIERSKAVKDLQDQMERDRLREVKTDLKSILALLPRPETERNQPSFHGAGDGYFLSDNGYSTKQMDSLTKWTVRFTNGLSSHATVEEMVLASAATLARKKGFAGFVVTSRRTFDRTTHVSTYGLYGGGSYDQNSGREAQMVVHLVNAGQLPDALKGADARFFDANKVMAELAAEYPEIAAKKR